MFDFTVTRPESDNLWEWVRFLFFDNFQMYVDGMKWTFLISLSGTIIGLFIAMLITPFKIQTTTRRDSLLMKFLKIIGRILTSIYVEVLRGTPMIVQAIIIYYAFLSQFVKDVTLFGITIDDIIVCGIFIVTINTSAYITEVLRGSINSIDKGQMEAARSLGMSRAKAMFHIIIPQALKVSIPAIGNEFVVNIKDTAVLNVIAVTELFFMTRRINGQYYRPYEGYIVAAGFYLFMTYLTTRLLFIVSKVIGLKNKSYPTSQTA